MRENWGDGFDNLLKDDDYWMDSNHMKHKISEMSNEYCYFITMFLKKRNTYYNKQFIVPDKILKKYYEYMNDFPELLL